MDSKKMIRNARKALDKSNANRYKGVLVVPPSVAHGTEKVRVKTVPVSHGSKVNLADYEDFE